MHQTNGTGYCSQEVAATGDSQLFEMFWDPKETKVTQGTSVEAVAAVKFDDAQGFSGSLVWNTRYLEVQNANRPWSPADAVVTGLLRL